MSSQGAPRQLSSESIQRLNHVFGRAVAQRLVPGIAVIALRRDGEAIFKQSWGTINVTDGSSLLVTASTKVLLASLTKAFTATAALQLVENEKLDMDSPIENYLPILKDIQVLEGFTADDEPILRKPKSKPTIRQLFTHTSGLSYEFLSEDLTKWRERTNAVNQLAASTRLEYVRPLAYDPGEGYSYGVSYDFLGFVIEEITGLTLDEYFNQHIFQVLGLKNSGVMPPEMSVHRRLPDNSITAAASSSRAPVSEVPRRTEVSAAGGHCLTSTLDDTATFLLALLNEGTEPRTGASILEAKTVKEYIFTDQLPLAQPNFGSFNFAAKGDQIGVFNSNNPMISNNGSLLPGISLGHSAGFIFNKVDIPERRKQGSIAGAGGLNLYSWVDPKTGVLGAVFTSLGPFLDVEVLNLFEIFEKEIYAGGSYGSE